MNIFQTQYLIVTFRATATTAYSNMFMQQKDDKATKV